MSNANPQSDLNALKCPSCGASLPNAGDRIECSFCGTIVERPRAAQSQQKAQQVSMHTVVIGGQRPRPAARSTGGGNCIGGLITLVVVLGIVIAIAVSLIPTSSGRSALQLPSLPFFTMHPSDKALLVFPDDAQPDAAPEVLALAYDSDQEKYHAVFVDLATPELLWQSEPLSKDALSNSMMAANNTMVVVTDKDQLVALNRADGTQLWASAMSDVISAPICEGCLQIIGERVVALTTDETLQAFDTQSGELVWRTQLGDYTGRQIQLLGDQIVVLNRNENVDGQVLLIDPSDGTVVSQFSPFCTQENGQLDAYPDDETWIDQKTSSIILLSGGSESCLHSYDLTTGEQQWQTLFETSFSNAEMLYSDGQLYFGEREQLFTADPGSGEVRKLLEEKNYYFKPLAAKEGVVLVAATDSLGTYSYNLWGVDQENGKRLWQRQFKDNQQLDDMSGTISEGDEGWTWQLTDSGLALIRVSGVPRQVTIETLGLRDGATADSKSFSIGEADDTLWVPEILGRSGNIFWLVLDDVYTGINVASGEKVYSWP